MSKSEEGSPGSKILVLAQAPSFVEERLDRPLVGPSGEVFDNCLHMAGLTRRECYILNIWPEQVDRKPIGTQEAYFTKGGDLLWHPTKGFTELGWEMSALCRERIAKSSANLILTLGAQAMELALGSKRPIMKWRGSILDGGPAAAGKKVIPTIHPAATIHGVYLWRYLIIEDMRKAKAEKEYPDLRLPKRKHIIGPGFKEALEYLGRPFREQTAVEALLDRNYDHVATDIEVINHQVSCFSICYQPLETMTIPLTQQDGSPYWSLEEEMEIWRAYARIMGATDIAKINQNLIGFDAVFLFIQNSIHTRGPLYDTMIAQSIMYPEFRMGLDFITSIRTREPYYKDEGKMWKGLGGPIEDFWTYCGKDAAVALESWYDLAGEMTKNGYWATYKMTARLANPLTYMSTRGFKADLAALKVTLDRVAKELADKYAELKAVAEWDFNPLSPKQCQQYFYGTKGLSPYKGTKGQITTDDKAMARIARRYNLPEAKLVQDIRSLNKLKGTYLEINFDKDGRLRCAWNPRGTWTGRLSSSETIFGTGANMQNLHPEFREFLIADEG